ncbi:Ger(x)C family spore germination protein [Fictibacillus fluitans]|uniref:Ger(X)C family spore germination protein n=1 Tax=Fictibacillus fluitans TaxID=3058422 RepID=A0ABT8HSW1_9BACL|nr:Ger(x)C family spore germination protein [Fictibacillus sp. NE201]MDN4523841.1 Ger(x)C family spore germination protein [Fictibacillus sp. NE201]
MPNTKLAAVAVLLFLTGCTPQKQVLEDIQLVGVVGYDYVDESTIRATVSVPTTEGGSDQAVLSSTTYSAKSHTSKNIRQVLQAESPRPFASGRVSVIIFNEELARRGITKIIDSLQRDPSVGRNIYLAVAKGKTQEMLSKEYPVGEIVPAYLKLMIEQNMELTFPRANFHHFNYSYYGKGSDPFMPLLEEKHGHIRITGVALFDHSKYVDHISFDNSFIFKLMYQSFRQGSHEFKLGKNNYLTLENLSSHVNYDIYSPNTNPKINITVDVTGKVNDAAGTPLYQAKTIEMIEKTIKKQTEHDAEKMVKRFQQKGIDPLGLGDRARSRGRRFNFKDWNQKYPDIPVQVKANIEVTQGGIVE